EHLVGGSGPRDGDEVVVTATRRGLRRRERVGFPQPGALSVGGVGLRDVVRRAAPDRTDPASRGGQADTALAADLGREGPGAGLVDNLMLDFAHYAVKVSINERPGQGLALLHSGVMHRSARLSAILDKLAD